MKIDTYDLEETGSGYMTYRDMVKCEESEWYRGDWVKVEDHDKVVNQLQQENRQLKHYKDAVRTIVNMNLQSKCTPYQAITDLINLRNEDDRSNQGEDSLVEL